MSATIRPLGEGKTRWRRFALAFVPTTGLLGLMLYAVSLGVLATPVVISGLPFTVQASSLTGTGFTQYGAVDFDPHGTPGGSPNCLTSTCVPTGVAVTELNTATLNGLHQTVCGPTGLGGINLAWANLSVVLESGAAGQPNAADATNLIVDATDLTSAGDSTFTNIKIGVPVAGRGPTPLTFGQTADTVNIQAVNQHGLYTAAGTFVVHGLHLTASLVSTC